MTLTSTIRSGVILAAKDVAALTTFYTTHLGFTLEASFEDPAYAILTDGRIRLSLAEEGHPAADLPDYVTTTATDRRRPSFMLVLEVADCESALNALTAAGVEARSEIFRPPWGGARAFIADPEDNIIELEELA